MFSEIETPFIALGRSNEPQTSERWPQRLERALIWGATMSSLFMLAAFVMTRVSPLIIWHWVTLTAGAISMIQGFGLSAVSLAGLTLPTIRLVADPTAALMTALDSNFRIEREQIADLARRFDAEQLDYSHARLCLSVAQLRARVALMVGPVDKLGIVPSAVSGVAYLAGLVGEQKYQGLFLPSAFVGAAILYLWSARLMFVALRLDRVALVAQRAAAEGAKLHRKHD
jgi:hypothetical protein